MSRAQRRWLGAVLSFSVVAGMVGPLAGLPAGGLSVATGNGQVATVGVAPLAAAVVPPGFAGSGQLYVINGQHDTLSVVSTATNTVTATIGLPGFDTPGANVNGTGVAVAPNGATAYVPVPSVLAVIPTSGSQANTVAKTVALPTTGPVSGDPFGVVVSPDSQDVYVAMSGGLVVVSATSDAVVGTIPLPAVGGTRTAGPLVISPDGTRLYEIDHGNGDDTVDVFSVHGGQGSFVTSVTVGSEPSALSVSPDGSTVFVANLIGGPATGGTISVISAATDAVIQTIGFPPVPVSSGGTVAPEATSVALSPTGQTLLVGIEYPFVKAAIFAVSTATDAIVGSPVTVGSSTSFLQALLYLGPLRIALLDRGTNQVRTLSAVISQLAPLSGVAALGHAFAGTSLAVGGTTGAVTYTTTASSPGLSVDPATGALSAPATLAVGTYQVSGTDTDQAEGGGTWSFALQVVATGPLVQAGSPSATTVVGDPFSATLSVVRSAGGGPADGATFTTVGANPPGLSVSSSGVVNAPGTLAPGVYRASGTDRDQLGETGPWSFQLTVALPRLHQTTGGLVAGRPDGIGYWTATSGGVVTPHGGAPFLGDLDGRPTGGPIVGMASTVDGLGYWLVSASGGVSVFGDAKFFGSMTGRRLNRPVVGIASTTDSRGYYLVAADGGVFTFGDARFFGSEARTRLNRPVVGMTVDVQGPMAGYWLVAADGGMFTFGPRARFFGSTGNRRLPASVVGGEATLDGRGYALLTAGGDVLPFGDARSFGPPGGSGLDVAGSFMTGNDTGYTEVAGSGRAVHFGAPVTIGGQLSS